jgi:hypothetical protein
MLFKLLALMAVGECMANHVVKTARPAATYNNHCLMCALASKKFDFAEYDILSYSNAVFDNYFCTLDQTCYAHDNKQ